MRGDMRRAADLHGLGARGGAGDLPRRSRQRVRALLRHPRAGLTRLLEGRATSRDWCDDRATPARESCDSVMAGALKTAIADLEKRYGSDRTRWRWGPAHFAHGEHRPFGLFPVIGSFFNVDVPSPGDPYTLNRGKVEFGDDPPFANRARLELPRHLRLRRPRALALHPHDRPVGQSVLALLPLVRGALGQGRLHRDSRPGARRSPRARSAPGSSRRGSWVASGACFGGRGVVEGRHEQRRIGEG